MWSSSYVTWSTFRWHVSRDPSDLASILKSSLPNRRFEMEIASYLVVSRTLPATNPLHTPQVHLLLILGRFRYLDGSVIQRFKDSGLLDRCLVTRMLLADIKWACKQTLISYRYCSTQLWVMLISAQIRLKVGKFTETKDMFLFGIRSCK